MKITKRARCAKERVKKQGRALKFKISNSNTNNHSKNEKILAIDMKTSRRVDVVLKSLPRIIKRFFFTNFKNSNKRVRVIRYELVYNFVHSLIKEK